jgi:hypothetical protein
MGHVGQIVVECTRAAPSRPSMKGCRRDVEKWYAAFPTTTVVYRPSVRRRMGNHGWCANDRFSISHSLFRMRFSASCWGTLHAIDAACVQRRLHAGKAPRARREPVSAIGFPSILADAARVFALEWGEEALAINLRAQREDGQNTERKPTMIDRQKVETVLSRRFPGATWEQIAVATNAIVGLEDEWREIECEPVFPLTQGREIRVFCRSVPQSSPFLTGEATDARSLPPTLVRSAQDEGPA